MIKNSLRIFHFLQKISLGDSLFSQKKIFSNNRFFNKEVYKIIIQQQKNKNFNIFKIKKINDKKRKKNKIYNF